MLISVRLLLGCCLTLAVYGGSPNRAGVTQDDLRDVRARDQSDRTWNVSQLLGKKGALIVARNSSEASRFCSAQLRDFEQARGAFERLGLKIVGLSLNGPPVPSLTGERAGIGFPVLSGLEYKMSRLKGGNEREGLASSGLGPGVYVLDQHGVIQEKYVDEDDKVCYSAANILVRRFGITQSQDQPRYDVVGKHLTAIPSVSNVRVQPGQRIALLLDLELPPDIHIYGPGTQGNIPLEWKVKSSEIASAHATIYPKPERLPSLTDQTVLGYSNHVRLIREITINPHTDFKKANVAGEFVVEGTLRYQACDDKMCYLPQDLPLLWTLRSGL